MKGLLIKDFKLMKTQKRFFPILVVVAATMAVSMEDTAFLMGYLTFVLPMFAVSTIGYDEFDNGNAFLFTLPISREMYVAEKYAFCGILALTGLGIGSMLSLAVGSFTDMAGAWEAIAGGPAVLGVMILLFCIYLPVQLKYGTEKGRLVFFVLTGFMGVLICGAMNLLKPGAFLGLVEMVAWLNAIPLWRVAIAGTALVVTAVAVSIRVSIGIMRKKAF